MIPGWLKQTQSLLHIKKLISKKKIPSWLHFFASNQHICHCYCSGVTIKFAFLLLFAINTAYFCNNWDKWLVITAPCPGCPVLTRTDFSGRCFPESGLQDYTEFRIFTRGMREARWKRFGTLDKKENTEKNWQLRRGLPVQMGNNTVKW